MIVQAIGSGSDGSGELTGLLDVNSVKVNRTHADEDVPPTTNPTATESTGRSTFTLTLPDPQEIDTGPVMYVHVHVYVYVCVSLHVSVSMCVCVSMCVYIMYVYLTPTHSYRFYAIIIIRITDTFNQDNPPERSSYEDAMPYSSTADPPQEYYVTAAWDDPNNVPSIFTVGDETTTTANGMNYENAALSSDSDYAYIIRFDIMSDTDEVC